MEDAAAKSLLGELPKPALDEFQPGAAGGDEAQMEARMLGKPGSDACVLVGLVVVEDQMQVELGWELAIEGAQELEELLLAVAPPPWQRLRPLQRLRRTRAKRSSSVSVSPTRPERAGGGLTAARIGHTITTPQDLALSPRECQIPDK